MTSGSIHFNEAVCGRQQDKDRKWQAGQELPCNLISLRFVFIHSLSWQITFEWETQARDDKWDRQRIGIKGKRGRENNYIRVWSAARGGESVCAFVCVCVSSRLSYPWSSSWIWCHDSLSLILHWKAPQVLMKCELFVCVYPWWTTCVWKSVSS